MPQYMYMQQQVRRQTGRHHGASPTPKTLCPTIDGRFINVFAMFTNVNSWRSLVGWMDSEGMAEDLTSEKYRDIAAIRMRSGPEVDHAFDVLRSFIQAHTAEEIYRGSQERKFPWGIVRTPDENLGDAHLGARGFFEEVEHPELNQSFVYPGRPYVFSKTPWATHRAPLLGEHNDKVYRDDLNMSQDELAALKADGTI